MQAELDKLSSRLEKAEGELAQTQVPSDQPVRICSPHVNTDLLLRPTRRNSTTRACS